MTTTTTTVTPKQIRQYHDEGYFVLESVVPPEHLELLRREATYAIDRIDAIMDAQGTDTLGLCHRGKRYFSSHVWYERLLRTVFWGDHDGCSNSQLSSTEVVRS